MLRAKEGVGVDVDTGYWLDWKGNFWERGGGGERYRSRFILTICPFNASILNRTPSSEGRGEAIKYHLLSLKSI